MKTILLNAIMCLLAFSPAFSAGPIVHFHAADGEAAVVVQLANLEQARTEIFLKTIDGRLQYSGFISGENGYSLRLAMEGMEEGTYILGVSNKAARELKAFTFFAGRAHFFEGQGKGVTRNGLSRNVSQPLGRKGQVLANISASGEGALINVRLSNLNSEPVQTRITSLTGLNWHQEVEEAHNGFSRNYITEGLPDGAYYLFLKAGATRIVQFFDVEDGQVVLGNLQRAEVPEGSRS